MTQIDNNAPKDVSKILIATKSDLLHEREISTEEGIALGNKFGIKFA